MSTTCLRWAMSQAVTGICHFRLSPWRPHTLFSSHRAAPCSVAAALSTTADGEGDGDAPRKKQSAHTRSTIGSVGRKIHQRHLQVIGHDGANLGTMHRADVLRLMDQEGLKLVPRNENKDPPVYQLMTGKQIHEEQLKLREKQKNKAGPVQVKELTLSSDIGSHDLDTKLRQIQSWLSKKCHVRLTLRKGNVSDTKPPDSKLEEILQRMPTTVGFVSKPKIIRDGKAAMCVLRAPSEKELLQRGALAKEPNQPPPGGAADADPTPDGTKSSPLQQ
ncbi:translation initiation factor IF-3, mitochondrial [Anguilla anguilla]|uniref:translation initiation factor IF-3, mitochondrial n=1 Tax=Anguilla anguilla TaxID=7936 RepID=UPI0015AA290F|nr:translation initiation factor IF-3, mitochondrial [Anguilla anguilla]XP_035291314.1 translation initiation factor IF-3, mitochondrial [Anguilla anguilla]